MHTLAIRDLKNNPSNMTKFLENNEKITNDDVEKMLSVSNATAERYLDELEQAGILRHVGNTGQSVYYEKIWPKNLNTSTRWGV